MFMLAWQAIRYDGQEGAAARDIGLQKGKNDSQMQSHHDIIDSDIMLLSLTRTPRSEIDLHLP